MSSTSRRCIFAVLIISVLTSLFWLAQMVSNLHTSHLNVVEPRPGKSLTFNNIRELHRHTSFKSPVTPPIKSLTNRSITTIATDRKTNKVNCKNICVPSLTRVATNSNKKILLMGGRGRLGNKMFQYAAMLGLARRHGFTPYVSKSDIIVSVFQISHTTDATYPDLSTCSERAAAVYDQCVETMDTKIDWKLKGYYQSWRYFHDIQKEVRKEFTFKPDTVTNALKLLNKSSFQFKGHPKVGVHVRRGDMAYKSSLRGGYTVADKEYFVRAMDYFRKVLKSPLFVVVTDDVSWSKRELGTFKDVVFIHESRDFDLAVLAHCQHSIVSTGSYGWWGAWLAGGKTVYYKNFPKNGTFLATQYKADDYFPPSWIGMT